MAHPPLTIARESPATEYAIKKFKPDREGENTAFSSGISQSAIREISLCREIKHRNIVNLEDIMLNPVERSISMVFEYAEHDLLVTSPPSLCMRPIRTHAARRFFLANQLWRH
jgi:cyclin-dependent kinase 8/11